MTGFAGTGQLSKLAFRRDGAVLPACVFGIAALLAITARDLKVLYPTAAVRLTVATRASANPALRFLLGRLNGTSVGAFLAARSPPGVTTARDCCQAGRDGRPPLISCMVHSAWRGGCSGLC